MRKIICLLAFITIAIMPMFAQETATKIKYCCPIKLDNNKNSVLDC